MQYTEQDLQKLVAAVEKEFTAHLAKAEESVSAPAELLAKAEDGEKKPESKEAEGEKKPEAEAKAPAEGDKKPEGEAKAPEGEAKPAAEAQAPAAGEAKPEGEAAAPAAAAPAGDDQCDYDDEDRSHMQKMYMSMSKGELKAHHDSCRAALDHKGMEKCGDMSMSKTETATSIEVKPEIVQTEANKELELAKAETAAEKARADGIQKNLDAVSAFLTKLVEKKVAPAGKAITSLDVVAKSEGSEEEKTLSKSEIDSRLNKKAADPKLEKSDREAINAFYLNGASINSISHLLK